MKAKKPDDIDSLLRKARSARIAYVVLSLIVFVVAAHYLRQAFRATLDFMTLITSKEIDLVFTFALCSAFGLAFLIFGLVLLLKGVCTWHTDKAIRILDNRLTALETVHKTEKSEPSDGANRDLGGRGSSS